MLQTGWLRVTTTHVPYSYRHYDYSMLFLFFNLFTIFYYFNVCDNHYNEVV